MKTRYLVTGLRDDTVLTSASLQSTGIETEGTFMVIGKYLNEFEDYTDAIECAKIHCKEFELGCKIETIFVKD